MTRKVSQKLKEINPVLLSSNSIHVLFFRATKYMHIRHTILELWQLLWCFNIQYRNWFSTSFTLNKPCILYYVTNLLEIDNFPGIWICLPFDIKFKMRTRLWRRYCDRTKIQSWDLWFSCEIFPGVCWSSHDFLKYNARPHKVQHVCQSFEGKTFIISINLVGRRTLILLNIFGMRLQ